MGGWDGRTSKGREDLEKDKTKSKRDRRSGRTPIRAREPRDMLVPVASCNTECWTAAAQSPPEVSIFLVSTCLQNGGWDRTLTFMLPLIYYDDLPICQDHLCFYQIIDA